MNDAVEKYIKMHMESCDNCGYSKGFHSSFHRMNPKQVKILLICPECGTKYDVKWVLELT